MVKLNLICRVKSWGSLIGFLFLVSFAWGTEDGQLSELKARAENGDAEAQFDLGLVYEKGGHVRDYAKARKWYQKAAEQGHTQALYNIGFMYERGRGVKQDVTEARKWYQRAARKGHPPCKNPPSSAQYAIS